MYGVFPGTDCDESRVARRPASDQRVGYQSQSELKPKSFSWKMEDVPHKAAILPIIQRHFALQTENNSFELTWPNWQVHVNYTVKPHFLRTVYFFL